MLNGLLCLNKPAGLRSTDAVASVRRRLPKKTKVGHAGTLDSPAEGLLILLIGRATRLSQYVMKLPKYYRATIRLGAVTDTDDRTGTVLETTVVPPEEELLRRLKATLPAFLGEKAQLPPAISAVRVGGERAHALQRSGKTVRLTPRLVSINRIDFLGYNAGTETLQLGVLCGKGTYIRSLARDLGEALQCGGYVVSLERSSIGAFRNGQAVSVDGLCSSREVEHSMLPVHTLASQFTRFAPSWNWQKPLRNGSAIPLSGLTRKGWGSVTSDSPLVVEGEDCYAFGALDRTGPTVTFQPETVLHLAGDHAR